MTFLNEEAWQGKVYSGGWIASEGGDTVVIEPATGHELGRIGLATPDDVTRAVKRPPPSRPGPPLRTPSAPRSCAGRPTSGSPTRPRSRTG